MKYDLYCKKETGRKEVGFSNILYIFLVFTSMIFKQNGTEEGWAKIFFCKHGVFHNMAFNEINIANSN